MRLEHRLHPRRPTSEKVDFIVPMLDFREIRYVNGNAEIINKSSGGICIKTETPLEVGHIVRIDKYIGLVKWVHNNNDSFYTAGLMCV